MAEQVSPLLDLTLQRLTHELDEDDIGPGSALHDSYSLSWRLAGRGRRNWQTKTTPTNISQYVHHSVLARGTAAIHPEFDLQGLPVWEPTGVELTYASAREPRTKGRADLVMQRESLCDRVVAAFGG